MFRLPSLSAFWLWFFFLIFHWFHQQDLDSMGWKSHIFKVSLSVKGTMREQFYFVWFNFLKLFYWDSEVSFQNFLGSHSKEGCTLLALFNFWTLKYNEIEWNSCELVSAIQSWRSELLSFTLLRTEPLEFLAGTNKAFSCLNYSTFGTSYRRSVWEREPCKHLEKVLLMRCVLYVDCRRQRQQDLFVLGVPGDSVCHRPVPWHRVPRAGSAESCAVQSPAPKNRQRNRVLSCSVVY